MAMATASYLGVVGERGWPEMVALSFLSLSAYMAQRLLDHGCKDGYCHYYKLRQRPVGSSGLLVGSVTLPLAFVGLSIVDHRAANAHHLPISISESASQFNLWAALVCGEGIIITFLLLNWLDSRKARDQARKDFDYSRTTPLSLHFAGCILSTCAACGITCWTGNWQEQGGSVAMTFWLMLCSCLCGRIFDFLLTKFPLTATAGEALLVAQGMSLYLLDALLRTLGSVFPAVIPKVPSHYSQLGHCDETHVIMQVAVIGVLAVAWISSSMHSWIELVSFSSAVSTPHTGSIVHGDSSSSSHCCSTLQLRFASASLPCCENIRCDLTEGEGDGCDKGPKTIRTDAMPFGQAMALYASLVVVVLAAAPSWLQLVCSWRAHPFIWILQFVFRDSLARPILCVFWIMCILGSVCVLSRLAKRSQIPRILLRKGFHAVATLMFVPALLLERDFLSLAFGIALAAFLLVEILRVQRIPPCGDAIHSFYIFFTDSRDSGPLIISVLATMPLAPFAGVLAIGVGDTMASLVGFCYGRILIFNDGKKTVEGTIAGILSTLLGCALLTLWTPQDSTLKVLLTDYLRCLPSEVRTKLVDEACVDHHNFASFSKKALDIEAKLGSAHQSQGDGRKKRLPQDWKKKGQLMFVDHDGQATEIDDFPDLGEETEHDGASVVEREVVHVIEVVPGSKVPRGRIYRMSPAELDELRRQLKELTEKGWIRPCTSPYDAPVLFVPKKGGTLRMCIDYRGLNAIAVKNVEPLPRIDDLLDKVQGCRYFTKIDLKFGYHQIAMRPEDQHKTAFQTRYGLYEFVVMPFGLCNAPGTFQHAMNRIFHDFLDKFIVVYLDDILIFSRTVEEHAEHLKTVLRLLRQHQYKVNLEKCEFGRTKILYLGHEISADGLRPDDAKVASIRDWPRPQTVTEVRSFLGMTDYYRPFVKNYSTIASPLTDLTRLDTPWEWTKECEAAFRKLKYALAHYEVLKLPDPNKPFVVTTDASQYGIGAVLAQKEGPKLRPIEYMIKKMPSQKLAKSTYERELYALYRALVHWRHYLPGRFFYVRSDHETLRWIKTQPMLSDALKRWIQVINMYDYQLDPIKGEYNKVADALSRRADYQGADGGMKNGAEPGWHAAAQLVINSGWEFDVSVCKVMQGHVDMRSHLQSLADTGSHWQSLADTGSHWQSLAVAVSGSNWQ
ncbi:hypothetical protein CBR_g19018 [Chara braunii]|uniref:Reverse transcriptase domain-containing protein n=1 Tax=Chara braunii TaxID=69332 RepID=A0A388KX05_CHABU|nr:hypothetical protein CBR_g19018 [Chara braunii]|eukprot:GBG74610.1 hypothetical protein CBR_g19018 [Chara braunii]